MRGDDLTDRLLALLKRHRQLKELLVPAYIDLDTEPKRAVPFPRRVWFGSPAGYLIARIDPPTGQLVLDEVQEVHLPDELLDEPTIHPVLADLTLNYMEEGRPFDVKSAHVYVDQQSDISVRRIRAIAFAADGGRRLLIDPYWPAGIRIGGDFDILQMVQNEDALREIEITL